MGAMQPVRTMADFLPLARDGRAEEGVRLVSLAVEAGDPEATFTLGDIYWRGAGVPQDFLHGRALMERASQMGHPVALRAITNLMASGIAGPRDWPGAMARLRAEARFDGRRAQMLQLIERMKLDSNGDPAALPRARQVSASPYVLYYQRLFTPEECDFLCLVAEGGYERQTVRYETGPSYVDPMRTAEGSGIHWLIEDPATHALNRRLAAASGTEYDQGEPLLVLRYSPGQEYKAHIDALAGEKNKRIKTALVYLNTEYADGETEFLKVGMLVKGSKGDAIVFRNVTDDGRPDHMSEHAGRPVTRGVKYLASRWIRAERHVA
jgi:prolyl 4-hydroxylase